MRQNRGTTLLAVLGVCLGLSASTPAETYHVDPDGSGNGGLGWDNAFRTLQDALTYDQLAEDDFILVAEGTYYPDEVYVNDVLQDSDYRTDAFRLFNRVTVMAG